MLPLGRLAFAPREEFDGPGEVPICLSGQNDVINSALKAIRRDGHIDATATLTRWAGRAQLDGKANHERWTTSSIGPCLGLVPPASFRSAAGDSNSR